MSGRVVRIFLSSTFRDFGEERDLLVRKVFPTLRARLQSRFVDLVDVDLRWGITEEEAERGEVLPICLSEIDRARPYFIGFLGERYGWIPPPDAYPSHVLESQAWLEEHRGGKSVTELEILHGVLNNPEMQGRALFYFRSVEYSSSKGGDYIASSTEDTSRQSALKEAIRKSGFPVFEDYSTPEHLAELLEQDLWEILDREFPASDIPDAYVRETLQHEAYALPRQRLYLGGDRYLTALDTALSTGKQWILIEGPSGGGKSALLANWLKSVRERDTDIEIHAHYLGATSDATDPVFLVRRLIECIKRTADNLDDLASDPDALMNSLPTWLAHASSWCEMQGKKFLFVIDALNGLADRRDLRWFPQMLPKHIHLVVSTLSGDVYDALQEKAEWTKVRVRPLNSEISREVFTSYLSLFNKTLPETLVERVMSHALAVNPLFLLTLAEELRLFGEHEQLGHRLDHYLESLTVDDLFERVLERIEEDYGAEVLQEIMTALWAARAGLREEEILNYSGLKPIQWAYIRNALGPTLIDASGRLIFAHDYMRIAVSDRYMAGNNTISDEGQSKKALALRCEAHQTLGQWFTRHAFNEHESVVSDKRSAEEIPYQWQQAKNWTRLEEFLTSASRFMGLIKHRSQQEALMYWRNVESHTTTQLNAVGIDLARRWYKTNPNQIGASTLLAWAEFLVYASRYQAALDSLDLLAQLMHHLTPDEQEQTALIKSDALVSNSDYDAGIITLHRLIKARIERSGEKHPTTAKLLNRLVAAEYLTGAYEIAKENALKALSIQLDIHGEEHPETVNTLNNLANIDIELSLYQDAITRHKQVAEIRRKIHGAMSVDYAQSLNNLARAHEGITAYEESLKLYQQSVAVYREVLGDYNADILKPISNLGLLLTQFNRLEEARGHQEHALRIAETLLPEDHPEIARLLVNLAVTETDFDKRKSYILRANRICKNKLGDHPFTSATFTHLAAIYNEEDNIQDAFDCFEQSIGIAKASTGPMSKSHADALRSMGDFLYRRDESLQARGYLEEALKIYDVVLPADDPWRSDVLTLLAFVMGELGEHRQALPYYQESLKIIEKVFPNDSFRIVQVLQNLGNAFLEIDAHDEAEKLFKRAVELQEQLHEPEDPDLARLYFDLANIYLELSRYPLAEEYYRKASKIEERDLGSDHPDIAITYFNLGRALAYQSHYSEAEIYFRKTLNIELIALDQDDPELALTFLWLGECQSYQKNFQEAEENLRKAYALQLTEYHENDPALERVLALLHQVLIATGNTQEAAEMHARLLALDK